MFPSPPDLGTTVALILAGGREGGLGALTDRCILPLGTCARLIDCTLNNCLHSGIKQVGVLTRRFQDELAESLQRRWGACPGMEVSVLPSFCGLQPGSTAEAVRENLVWLVRQRARRVLLLPGDQLYRFDYQRLLDHHQRRDCAVSALCLPESRSLGGDYGGLSIDARQRVSIGARLSSRRSRSTRTVASTGIFVLEVCVLAILLRSLEKQRRPAPGREGLGSRLISAALDRGLDVSAYLLPDDAYWRDISTPGAYYAALNDLKVETFEPFAAGWQLPDCFTRSAEKQLEEAPAFDG